MRPSIIRAYPLTHIQPHAHKTQNSYQNAEKRIPLREDSIFRIFSQSKPVSTAAFLTLIDEVRAS